LCRIAIAPVLDIEFKTSGIAQPEDSRGIERQYQCLLDACSLGKQFADQSLTGNFTLIPVFLRDEQRGRIILVTTPQKIKPGANMPNFMLSPNELDALTTYLERLK